ncbi:hypothetical protein SteCoe_17185 [Stentor coeruleus]|uniref:Leishmanolysin-like peptidase n=1 Tax=Stentor coeruleus TaxID=5963 RepID=A0A1R2BZG4_9CILI|nr:hypothetical protein SteCoe_17185 [Stentor coeruleus]
MFWFNFLICYSTLVQSTPRFCAHDEWSQESPPQRILDTYRETGWDSLRIKVDWSNMSKSTKAKYSKYLESAVDFYANSLEVHRYKYPFEWSSDSKSLTCNLNAGDFYGKSISADYFVIMTETFDSSLNYVASAKSCAIDSNHQPIVGVLKINTAYTDEYDSRLLIGVMTHELTHALGFSLSSFVYYKNDYGEYYENLFKNVTLRDLSTIYLTTPNVKSRAQKLFGCNSLPGAELETQGDLGTAYSHWNSRIAFNDLMNPQAVFTDFVYSELTFAVLEDSGWYKPDYSYAQQINFGYKEGCEFHDKKCLVNEKPISRMFCDDFKAESLCTHDYLSKGKCNLYQYSFDLPDYFKYFSDPTLGGDPYTDFCPVVSGNFNCRIPGCANADFMEEICEDCRCVEGTYSLSKTYEEIHASCHRITCGVNFVIIHIGIHNITCTETGTMMNVPGFNGKLRCPDIEAICRTSPCLNNCYGNECNDGVCDDDSLNRFDDCNTCNNIPNDCGYTDFSNYFVIFSGSLLFSLV